MLETDENRPENLLKVGNRDQNPVILRGPTLHAPVGRGRSFMVTAFTFLIGSFGLYDFVGQRIRAASLAATPQRVMRERAARLPLSG